MGRVPWSVKWLLVPVGAALLGYYVVGPRMAGKSAQAIQKALHRVPPTRTPSSSPEPATSSPRVTVGVRPVGETSSTPDAPSVRPSEDRPTETPRPRRRRRRRHRTTTETPASTPSGPDPASTPGP